MEMNIEAKLPLERDSFNTYPGKITISGGGSDTVKFELDDRTFEINAQLLLKTINLIVD